MRQKEYQIKKNKHNYEYKTLQKIVIKETSVYNKLKARVGRCD